MLKRIVTYFSNYSRQKRANLFIKHLQPNEKMKILDLGGGDGSHISSILPFRENIYIADVSDSELSKAKEKGYNTIKLNDEGILPFEDNEFDILFCSSVIEHVTVKKAEIFKYSSSRKFYDDSFKNQKIFADEINRVGKKYFVQTPNKWFIVESHTLMPSLIVLFPRSFQIKTISIFNKFWIKKTNPDWNLLTIKDMKYLFPEAEIVTEKSFGLIKSIMAIKK